MRIEEWLKGALQEATAKFPDVDFCLMAFTMGDGIIHNETASNIEENKLRAMLEGLLETPEGGTQTLNKAN